jgi:hypothetical protein
MKSEQKTKKHPGGRPSKINLINLKQVKKLILAGLTDAQICDILEINNDTFCEWKKKNKEFSESIKDWKAEADLVIEKSLYHRGKGYQHEEDKIFCENGVVTVVPTIHHYPPDATSMIFWLKNRQPEKWREKTEIDLGLKENLMEKFSQLNTQDLIKKLNELTAGK